MRKLSRAVGLVAPIALVLSVQTPAANGHTAPSTAVATVETPSVFNDDAGGNADSDDPEVWLHPDDSDDSLVLGTEKENGLSVFDLKGRVIQHLDAPAAPGPGDATGRINNLDVLYDYEVAGDDLDIAVATDRGLDKLHIYAIDPDKAEERKNPLTEITDPSAPFLFSKNQAEVNEQNTAYGVAAWKDAKGVVYVLVTREHRTEIGLFRLLPRKNGTVGYEPVRKVALPATFTLPNGASWTPCDEPGRQPQSEGMVVDTDRGVVYVSQEGVGIWRMDADLSPFQPKLIDKVREFGVPATYDAETDECVAGTDPGFGGKNLSADAEGLTIYQRSGGRGYLIASSQGDSTYAVYDREGTNRLIGSFRIGDGKHGIDSTQNTDSLFVTNSRVGSFKKGLLLVQDGNNTPDVTVGGEVRENTNFKFVPWENVARSFSPALAIDTEGHDPRGD
ncbi:phytase [Lentzea flaviverrucosa]|uniref:3-phytase n=1 Tax=Lentzea flaviverrucosa TaxID=200379 RepID=A0A1H9XRY9_9PSEU|nr:phytase [Lentzea flaviverrucosa]RDI19366.1 3-phytase [Lentzea flaviverrucosa]SES48908.1 3-phytase [Lentzea flaviverrucosa]